MTLASHVPVASDPMVLFAQLAAVLALIVAGYLVLKIRYRAWRPRRRWR
jgi:amino acid transporter